jgi:hypothetical protein
MFQHADDYNEKLFTTKSQSEVMQLCSYHPLTKNEALETKNRLPMTDGDELRCKLHTLTLK